MKKKMLSVILATSLCLQPLAASASAESNKNKEEFIRGVDISTLDMLEDLGAKYYSNGVEDDALEILNNNGANFVRLKLWVNPYDEEGNPYGGGNNDFDTTLSLAKRADALNMGHDKWKSEKIAIVCKKLWRKRSKYYDYNKRYQLEYLHN